MSVMKEQSGELETDGSALRPRRRGWLGLPRLSATIVSRRARAHRSLTVMLAGAWVTFALLVAIAANWLPIRSPAVPIGIPNTPPHWGAEFFGLDAVGRSMISRLVFGARTSYEIAICTTAVALCVGCAIGLVAVYVRGVVSFLADLLCNVILSIPGVLLLLTIAVAVKPSYIEVIGAISLLFLPGFIRLARATALSQIEEPYVLSARGLGASPARIIIHELLPNTLVALVTYAGVVLPSVMLIEGALSYLGYGLPAPASSWGEMIALGQADINVSPWQAVIPALIFAVNVMSLYILTDWLRLRVDVKGIDRTP